MNFGKIIADIKDILIRIVRNFKLLENAKYN